MSEAKLAETVRLLETAWTTALGVWSAEADLFSKARQGALGVPSVVGLKGCPGQAVHAPAATANCAKTYSVLSALCGAALPTALAERSISDRVNATTVTAGCTVFECNANIKRDFQLSANA